MKSELRNLCDLGSDPHKGREGCRACFASPMVLRAPIAERTLAGAFLRDNVRLSSPSGFSLLPSETLEEPRLVDRRRGFFCMSRSAPSPGRLCKPGEVGHDTRNRIEELASEEADMPVDMRQAGAGFAVEDRHPTLRP